jgi:surfactin synthase thioesterase subunit
MRESICQHSDKGSDVVKSEWFFHPRPQPEAAIRLFCFPQAGGAAAAYRDWPAGLPESVEVLAIQAPGRGWRLKEPAYADLSNLVEAACDAMRPQLTCPYALFGHSMGAVVAFEVASRLTREGSEPAALFVAAWQSPGLPNSHPSFEHLSDSEFVEAIDQRFGGIPDVIRNSPEMLALLLPTLRTDVTALANYRYRPEGILSTPVYALGGTEDPTVTEHELSAWREVTRGPFLSRMFRGDHFFIDSSRSEVLALVASALDALSISSGSVDPAGSESNPALRSTQS